MALFAWFATADRQSVIDQLLQIFQELQDVLHPEELGQRLVMAGQRAGFWERAEVLENGHIQAFPCPDSSLLSLMQSFLDSTREKLGLKRERLRLRALLDNLPDLVWLKSESGEFLESNRRFQSLFGCSREELVGKTDHDLVSEELAQFFRANDRRALEAGGPVRNEEWVTFADDHQELLETVKTPYVEEGCVVGVLGIGRNYTEYWTARRRLVESEQRLRLFLEHSPAAVAMFDRDMNYLLVSQRFAVDYRLSKTDLVGKNHWEVFPDLPDRWRQIHLRCLAGAVESCPEDQFPRADGSLDWVRWEIRPWFEIDGRIGGLILFSELITATKLAERALRDNEELLRTMFEAAPIGIALLDTARGSVLRVNPTLCQLTGYSQAELVSGQGELWAMLRNGGHSQELQYSRQDGSLAWVEVRHCQLAGADQTIMLVQDIRQRRLLEDQRRLQTSALQAAAQGIVITDARGRVEWANQAFLQHTGYGHSQILGQSIGMLKSGQHDSQFYASLWETLNRGQVWHGEMVNRHRDGQLLFIEETITPVCDEDGQTSHFVAIQQDISERLQSQEALARSEEKFRGLVESLDDLLFCSDSQGRITFINRAVGSFSWLPEQLLGRPLQQVVHPQDAADLRVGHHELRLLDAQGNPRAAWCRLRREKDGGLTMVCTDLTRQRETEEQLRAAQRMEAVGRLAGGVAHDFNNLLTVILSYSELAQSELSEGDPLYDDIEEIRSAGKRAEGLTRQLLTFSRRQLVQLESVDLNQLMAGLTRMLQRLIGEDVELSFSGETELRSILADRGQLEQVLMNLAVNARDAMPDGGRVEVRTSNQDLHEDQALSLSLAAGPFVCLSVQDSGCGMDEATQMRIFEPFFTTKQLGKGTGLGLSTVYGIVKQSGGAISVKSQPGQGTCMKIYFPASFDQSASPARLDRSIRSGAAGESLLVVEDEPALRSVLKRVLSNAGYQVEVAANAGEALLLCEEIGPRLDLVLTDVIMPGMNGLELAQRLKPLCPRAKQMFMSGYTDEALERFDLSGENFLSKPFDWEIVNLRIRAVLDS